jgi:hypothetical protein
MNAREIWILPDRMQTGIVKCLEGNKIHDLHKSLMLNKIPKELSLGIPEEVYENHHKDEHFIFSQLAQGIEGEYYFCVSSPAGKDRSNRSVAISYFQIMNNKEPNLNPAIPGCPIISDEDHYWAKKMFSFTEKLSSINSSEVQKMLEAANNPKNSHLRSFTSKPLTKALYKPDWPRQKKTFLTTKAIIFVFLITLALTTIRPSLLNDFLASIVYKFKNENIHNSVN